MDHSFTCVCHLRFISKTCLETHQESVHGSTIVSSGPHTCQLCQLTFSTDSKMEKHKNMNHKYLHANFDSYPQQRPEVKPWAKILNLDGFAHGAKALIPIRAIGSMGPATVVARFHESGPGLNHCSSDPWF